MRYVKVILAAALAAVSLAAQAAESRDKPAEEPRNPRWAVAIEKPGLPNLHKVSDNYYRGAQPTAEGFRELDKMGVKTVINLRGFHSDRDEIEGTTLAYEHISFKAWHPEEEDVVRFLKIVLDGKRGPFFVHCQHGADRTGLMTAIYRVVVEGRTKDEAIEEMVNGGYGFHMIWDEYMDYLRKLDLEKLKAEAEKSLASAE